MRIHGLKMRGQGVMKAAAMKGEKPTGDKSEGRVHSIQIGGARVIQKLMKYED